MDNYFEYNQRTTRCGSLQRVLRDVRRMPTYCGCDPYRAFLGFSA